MYYINKMPDTLDLTSVPTDEPVVSEVVEDVEPAPANEVVEDEPAPAEEPVSTQEVVQNVQEMLTTEPAVSSDSARLEERVKVLEERLEKLVQVLNINRNRRELINV